MNILILNWRDIKHPLTGGAEISLFEHAKYWVNKKAKVIWFSSSYYGSPNEEFIDGIIMIRRGSHYTVHIYAFLYYILGKLGNPDIVIDSFHFVPFFTPLYIKKVKIALINEVASKLWYSNLPFVFAFIACNLEPFLFKIYTKINFITGSNSTRKELMAHNIKQRNIHVVHHGIYHIGTSKIIRKEKNPTVIFLGRVAKDKGIYDAIRSMSNVKCQMSNVKFWIVGKEESKQGLTVVKQMVKDCDIDDITTFFGFVSEKKKFELLKKAWILIHPSIKEGWGLTVIEAASQGTPTVGYNVAGLKDSVIHKKTGLLVGRRPDKLALNIIKLTADKKLYNKLSKEGLLWSKQFDWRKSGRASWKLLHRISHEKTNK